MEQSEREKIRKLNCKGEPIYRSQNDHLYSIETPVLTPRTPYPWESETNLPRITKDFFRCKGSSLNPPIIDTLDPSKPTPIADCEGCSRHGLPIIRGKENVYPILVDLLNYIQKKTGKRVVITCGHRCPIHNTYADPSKDNRVSKHQIGAEVDFYVQGMEERPQEIVGLLMQYFHESPIYKNQKESQEFKRYTNTDLAVQPWMNKEIFIKLFQKDEGRDLDNRHPHPYLSIQVRYDRDTKERVIYTWAKANKGYPH
ncbi:MAG: hypothetical protein COT85_07630 [Chlamydiae bacterium CG10_big_fil_rev_8_21_14_0_10_42_34]|nr:MAG: hypothetical protein COT85_07630 [Chlamydiae bacterium CG10_big_fil_rev_8_21_14_0_10_42_34]